jgi:hypothetical protein
MIVKTIIVTLEIDVPDNATDNDISDWVDVEWTVWSRKFDNHAWLIMGCH